MEAVGIEIEISKKNNITVVESNSAKRFRIKSYDEVSNFCLATDFDDVGDIYKDGKLPAATDEKFRDLLMSEIFELKNLWFVYNKKINSVLSILPSEVLGRYDMVAKTLQPPVFDVSRYPHNEGELSATFNEIVYKMA